MLLNEFLKSTAKTNSKNLNRATARGNGVSAKAN